MEIVAIRRTPTPVSNLRWPLLLSAALLLLWLPSADSPKTDSVGSDLTSKTVATSTKTSSAGAALPDAPVPKVDSVAVPAETSVQPFPVSAIKPAVERPVPTPRQQKLWYTFLAASHGAAAFDAWSTRRAVSGNYGTESDPLLRPFAHSNAIYAATQISPAVMDYLGRRMMTSGHPTLRRFWWIPQVAGAGVSFASGMHNYSIVP
jgi:hypothetical protein